MLYQLSYLAAVQKCRDRPEICLLHPPHSGIRKVDAMLRQRVSTLGAPLDLGSSGRRGVDMGPSAIRYAGLADHLARLGTDHRDLGDVDAPAREQSEPGDASARYLAAILETCDEIGGSVASVARSNRMPLVLGGDHSVAFGSLLGMAAVHGAGGALWLDAHGDINTPATTASGNVHGMPLAAALGVAGPMFDRPGWALPTLDLDHVALVGVRSLDAAERELVSDLGLSVFTMSDIDRRGLGAVMSEAIEVVRGASFVHLSLDLDVIDPRTAPGVGTPVPGGLGYREAHLATELIAEADIVSSIDIVELNPILDVANATGRLAVELAASALGKRIL